MEKQILLTVPIDEFEAIQKEWMRQVLTEIPNNEQEKDNQLLTRKETAGLLQVSLVTLDDWSKKGFLQSYRIGNRIRYKKEEVEKSLQQVKNLKYKRG